MRVVAAAPANIMLLGEYSVLEEQPAIGLNFSQYLEVSFELTNTHKIDIVSSFASLSLELDFQANDYKTSPLNYTIYLLEEFCQQMGINKTSYKGSKIVINSQIPTNLGLGSSAALLAALVVVLDKIYNTRLDKFNLFKICHDCIKKLKNYGSGADVAFSLTGGLSYFDYKNQKLEQISLTDKEIKLKLFYAGYKLETAKAIKKVIHFKDPESLARIYAQMGATTKAAISTLKQTNDIFTIVNEIASYNSLMADLGCMDETLTKINSYLKTLATDNPIAFKISGAGFGDCILALFQNQDLNLATKPAILANGKLNSYALKDMSYKLDESGARIMRVEN